MKHYNIVSRLKDFEFPMREATRKQIWWFANQKAKNGYKVNIIILSNSNSTYLKDGIKISIRNRWLWFPDVKADKIQFITGSISIWLLFGFFFRGEKTLKLTDGDMFGTSFVFIRRLISKLVPFIYKKIIVFSSYQKERLNIKDVIIEKPILPKITINKKHKRYLLPTLLYMGHLSYFKGVDTILESFKYLVNIIPNITLIIADNSIQQDLTLANEVRTLKNKYSKNIILKGIVDPIEELTKAWIYLYPFKKPLGTMAYALSLYEAECCGIDYIACDVGANKEFFNRKNLIEVGNSDQMSSRIIQILNERKTKINI